MSKPIWWRMGLGGLVMFAVLVLTACGGDESNAATDATGVGGQATATTTPGSDDATNEPVRPGEPSALGMDGPPSTTASAKGQSVETGIGTFCWTLLCVDKIGVPTRGVLVVSNGDVVTIRVPDGVPPLREVGVAVFDAVNAQILDDGSEIWPYPGSPGEPVPFEMGPNGVEVPVELPPGTYVLAVNMYFERGDVVYGVLLDVR
jgi:hypothetical protein